MTLEKHIARQIFTYGMWSGEKVSRMQYMGSGRMGEENRLGGLDENALVNVIRKALDNIECT